MTESRAEWKGMVEERRRGWEVNAEGDKEVRVWEYHLT